MRVQNSSVLRRPFRVREELSLCPVASINAGLTVLLEHLSGLRGLEKIYGRITGIADRVEFLQAILDELGISVNFANEITARIPRQGRVVVVANHPFGCVEGILLARLLLMVRSDVKIMANYHLQKIPQISDLFIGVDPFAGAGSEQRNGQPMRESLRWLRNEGLLLIFPSGAVSHWHLTRTRVADPAWSPTVGRLIRLSQTPVLPVYFPGRNSLLFQAAGLVHPRLRTLLIPREILNKRNREIPLQVGQIIPYKRLQSFTGDADLITHLRLRTYTLADEKIVALRDVLPLQRAVTTKAVAIIASPVAATVLAAEMAALPAENLLAESGSLRVYFAQADQILWLMREIGRLRETTFRQVGEGTGNTTDIDLFDAYYVHLFIWDASAQCVVGAYRLGLTDRILQRYGKKGLYTNSLFKYKPSVLAAFNPGIELGRSFIRLEYQRSFTPLLLLWKGIGAFVSRHPRYRLLFGPVSISGDYLQSSRQILVDYLHANSFETTLARYVKPRHPFRRRGAPTWKATELASLPDIDALSELIANLERDEKGVPILLKQYLKLGGRILGFNVDNKFNDALDGLIMVDLCQTEPRVLARYMGSEASQRFLAFHDSARADWPQAS
jgi:putative hemolysin